MWTSNAAETTPRAQPGQHLPEGSPRSMESDLRIVLSRN